MARKTRRRRIKRSRRVKGVKGTRRVRRYYRGGTIIPQFMTAALNSVTEQIKSRLTPPP